VKSKKGNVKKTEFTKGKGYAERTGNGQTGRTKIYWEVKLAMRK